MRAACLHSYRDLGSLRGEEVKDPHAGPNELLIRVHAAGVTPSEILWGPTSTARTGEPRPLPIILGHEFSGEIAALGPGVTRFAIGDAVYGLNDWFADGADAEFCLVADAAVAHKPQSVDHPTAAVAPISGLTAWQGLFDRAELARGQRILIHGGAGAVGVFAVQLAHWRGAHVLTTVSSHNAEFVRRLGADEVIDYKTTRFEDVAHDLDVVFDTVGGDTLQRSWAVLKPGGRVVSIAAGNTPKTQASRDAFFIVEANGTQLTELARLIDGGHVRPVLDGTFPLAQAREAYAYRPQRGKAALQMLDEELLNC